MRGTAPQEGSFHFASRFKEKEPKLQKATKMSMKVHVSSLHAPIYRNFYLCVGIFFLSNQGAITDLESHPVNPL